MKREVAYDRNEILGRSSAGVEEGANRFVRDFLPLAAAWKKAHPGEWLGLTMEDVDKWFREKKVGGVKDLLRVLVIVARQKEEKTE